MSNCVCVCLYVSLFLSVYCCVSVFRCVRCNQILSMVNSSSCSCQAAGGTEVSCDDDDDDDDAVETGFSTNYSVTKLDMLLQHIAESYLLAH